MKHTNYEQIMELYDKGLSWDEIRDTLDWFTDTDRKKFYGYRDAMETLSTTLASDKLDQRLQRIRLNQKILGLERSINNEQIRDLALAETLTNQLRQSLKGFKTPKLNTPPSSINDVDDDLIYIITSSDYHHDGDVLNLELDFSVMLHRIKEEVRRHNIRRIIWVEGGDIVEGAGNLRNSQAQAVKAGMIPQLVQFMGAYLSFLTELSSVVNIERIITVTSSNHTQLRPMGSKSNELVEEDLMLVFASFLDMTVGKQIPVHAEEQPWFHIGDFSCKLMHGHTIKNKNNLASEMHSISSYDGVLYDYIFAGHFHHLEVVDVSEVSDGYDSKYDRQFILLPTSDRKPKSTFEKDRKLASTPGLGLFCFSEKTGLDWFKKIKL